MWASTEHAGARPGLIDARVSLGRALLAEGACERRSRRSEPWATLGQSTMHSRNSTVMMRSSPIMPVGTPRRGGADVNEAERLCERAFGYVVDAPNVFVSRAEVFVARGDIGEAVDLDRPAASARPMGSRRRLTFEQRIISLGR